MSVPRKHQGDGGASRIRDLEAALRRSEETLRIVLDAAWRGNCRIGHWEMDLRTGEFTGSPTFRNNLGLAPDAPLAMESIAAMRHPDDADQVAEATRAALESGRDYDVAYRVKRADGSIVQLAERGRAIVENGSPTRLIGATLDISGRERDRPVRERRHRFLADLDDRLRVFE